MEDCTIDGGVNMYTKDNLQVKEAYAVTFCTKSKQSGGSWSTDLAHSRQRLEEFLRVIEQRTVSLDKTMRAQQPQRWKNNDEGVTCIVTIEGAGVSLLPNEGIHESFLASCRSVFARQCHMTSNESIVIKKC